MRLPFTLVFTAVIAGATALPQDPGPDPPPVDDPPPDQPPAPIPAPPTDEPPAPGPPPATPVPDVPAPTVTGGPPGPICECGYTYCASVLQAMKEPWQVKQLAQAYCNTANATCPDNQPRTNVEEALFVCLCDDAEEKLGNQLDLLCGCDECLVVGPDFRGRCAAPCYGSCEG
ncbi:hypothetical protein NLU13_7923 [Sarocladium strictum]|uniref:Uncharacterized protein n=1 Tax=Sarocladium strictum TaxID=5046 RepID=A0AA39GDQ8_SARSR|nr:hypothetical protein NLU13_7923 [Sarocladium strictum]